MKMKTLIVIGMICLLLSACQEKKEDAAAQAVESYLQALVDENQERLLTGSCADWEEMAILELDAFIGVSATLNDMQCTQTAVEGDTAFVACSGSIEATYNNEQRALPLEGRAYQVIKDHGNWLVCGYEQ